MFLDINMYISDFVSYLVYVLPSNMSKVVATGRGSLHFGFKIYNLYH
jgi:hypothetical protein